jgi:protoheme IX farnesyltransferase
VRRPEVIKNYILVTKPGIIFGNLISVAGGFFLASKGRIDIAVLLWTLIGMSLVIASGCVFNNCIDKNMDRKMARTHNRVLAKGLMSPGAAVVYGSLMGIVGTLLLRAATNMLSVVIVLTGFTIYVGMYSLYLKRHSVYGTLIGSLAGAAPPLAGYCAVRNCFDMGAFILLAIFTLWQMPHSYAIAIFRYKDYAAAAIPVLPVKRGMRAAKKHVVGYMLAFVAATLMLTFGGYTGYSYLAVAAAMGLSWLYMAWSGYKTSDDRAWAKKLFVSSILTITVLSVMMSIDPSTRATASGRGPSLGIGSRARESRQGARHIGYAPGLCSTVQGGAQRRICPTGSDQTPPYPRRIPARVGLRWQVLRTRRPNDLLQKAPVSIGPGNSASAAPDALGEVEEGAGLGGEGQGTKG